MAAQDNVRVICQIKQKPEGEAVADKDRRARGSLRSIAKQEEVGNITDNLNCNPEPP